MLKKIFSRILSQLPQIVALLFIGAIAVYAWQEPGQAPPAGNVLSPLNIGPAGQSKEGGLILNTGGADTGLIVAQGSVGIGTTNPLYKLDVVSGGARIGQGVAVVEGGSLAWFQTNSSGKEAEGVAVDSTGVYIVGHDSISENNWQWRMEKRSLADGSVMWSKTINPSAYKDNAYGVAVDSTGIYVVGTDWVLGNNDSEWRMEKRRLTDGTIIWTQTSNSGYGDEALAVAVDSTGVYIVGYGDTPQNDNNWRMEKRSLDNGNLIWTQTSDPSISHDLARGVAIDSTGVYVVGSNHQPNTNGMWRIEKRDYSSGNLIWAVNDNLTDGNDFAGSVFADGTAIYVAGRQGDGGRIEKRNPAGDLIWTQANNSFLPFGGVVADNTGIFIAGYEEALGQWRMEKRSLDNGNLIWTQASNPSNSSDVAKGVAIDSAGVYVVGYENGGSSQWRIEKRWAGSSVFQGFVVDSEGNVGIGIENPTVQFETACPTGFTNVKAGNNQLGCIQTGERSTDNWFGANNDCFINYGGRLPSAAERRIAMVNYDALIDKTDDWEWVDDFGRNPFGGNPVTAMMMGMGSYDAITESPSDAGYVTPYRCWVPR